MGWHTHTAMACGITWKEAFMHADTTCKTHEMMHFRPLKPGAGGWLVLGDVDIGHNHITRSIHKVSVEVRFMPLVFLDHFEIPYFGRVLLIPGRKC